MDPFDFPDLIPDEDPDKHPEELHNKAKQIRYCFLKTKRPQELPSCTCGNTFLYRYGTRTHSYRDLPRLQARTVLVIKRQRYLCRKEKNGPHGCGKAFVQEVAGLDPGRSMTTRCLEWIRANCLRYTSEHIAEHIGCDPRTVREIAYMRIRELKDAHRPYLPEWLGIDETYFKGYINTRCCVFVDLQRKRPIDLIDSRPVKTGEKTTKGKSAKSGPKESELIRQWLVQFSDSSHLAGVAMDMSESFRQVVKEVFPGVEIVADRYHVEKWANKAVDRVRDSSEKLLRKELSKKGWDAEEWRQKTRLLRKHRGQISDGNELTKRDKSPAAKKIQKTRDRKCEEDFLRWLELHPKLKVAYELKESFCNIYNNCKRRYEARQALQQWASRFPKDMRGPFKEVLRATRKWRIEFLAYFPVRKSNGYTEAFNSVLKRMNRSGNNYSFDVLWAKAIYGRKPEQETVKLRPPSLEQFAIDSRPARERCLYCENEYRTCKTADLEDALGRFITFRKVSDKWVEDGYWRCPICNNYMTTDVLQPVVPAAEFSVEYCQDAGVGDEVSADRFEGNFCANCSKPFNADQLFDAELEFLAVKPGEILVCASCRDQDLARRKRPPVASTEDVKRWWMDRLKMSEFAVEHEEELSGNEEGELPESPQAPKNSSSETSANSMPLGGCFRADLVKTRTDNSLEKAHTQSIEARYLIQSQLNKTRGGREDSADKSDCSSAAATLSGSTGKDAGIPPETTQASDQEAQGAPVSKGAERRSPLLRLRGRDLKPIPKSAQLSFEFQE
jgi:transposase